MQDRLPQLEQDPGLEQDSGAEGADVVLRLQQIRFAWPGNRDFALSLESFQLCAGEKLLLMGPSGSGKSTLLSLICGFVRPSAGVIQGFGSDLTKLRGAASDRFRADHFGIIFQMFNLLPYASVLDNVLLPLGFSKARLRQATSNGTAAAEARRLLGRLGLADELLARKANALSVGQQQRVAAARALIGRPDVVIADEPTSALDPERRQAFLELLLEEIEAAGASLVMVSHDPLMVDHFDRVLRIDDLMTSKGPEMISRGTEMISKGTGA